MLLQPSLLMPIGTLPMGDCGEAAPDESPDLRPIRTITRIVDRLRTATRVARRPQAIEAKEHIL